MGTISGRRTRGEVLGIRRRAISNSVGYGRRAKSIISGQGRRAIINSMMGIGRDREGHTNSFIQTVKTIFRLALLYRQLVNLADELLDHVGHGRLIVRFTGRLNGAGLNSRRQVGFPSVGSLYQTLHMSGLGH